MSALTTGAFVEALDVFEQAAHDHGGACGPVLTGPDHERGIE